MTRPIYTKRGSVFEYMFTPADQDKYRSWYTNLVADVGASIAADKVVPEFHVHSSADSLIHKLATFYEDFEVYILCDYFKEQYAYVALEKGGVSPHVDGSVCEIALCISNLKDKAPLSGLMRRIIQQAKYENIDYLITHKHAGHLEYRARYHKLKKE